MKILKEEILDNDEILNVVNETEEKDRAIKDIKKDHPKEITKLKEAFFDYMGENDLKLLKQEFPDKWNYLTENLAYPYEYFKNLDDYQNPVDKLKNKISSVN